jgi:hypothetical protein
MTTCGKRGKSRLPMVIDGVKIIDGAAVIAMTNPYCRLAGAVPNSRHSTLENAPQDLWMFAGRCPV